MSGAYLVARLANDPDVLSEIDPEQRRTETETLFQAQMRELVAFRKRLQPISYEPVDFKELGGQGRDVAEYPVVVVPADDLTGAQKHE